MVGLADPPPAGLRYVASVRVLVILTTVQMVVNLCLAAEKLIVFYARDTLGLTPSLVAVVAAGWLAGLRRAGHGGGGARR